MNTYIITLRITVDRVNSAADEWDWHCLLDLGPDETVEVEGCTTVTDDIP